MRVLVNPWGEVLTLTKYFKSIYNGVGSFFNIAWNTKTVNKKKKKITEHNFIISITGKIKDC